MPPAMPRPRPHGVLPPLPLWLPLLRPPLALPLPRPSEKRPIGDVASGDSIATRARAHLRNDSEEEDEEEEEEEEVSAVEDSGAKQKSGATCGNEVKDAEPDELLRAKNLNDLQKQNSAKYKVVVGNGRQPGITTCVSIFPQEQSAEGVEHLSNHRNVWALLRRLRSLDYGRFWTEYPDGRIVHHQTLRI